MAGDETRESLAWNKDVPTDVEERVFLALRQLNDGSMVYFLTLTDVVNGDHGDYFCAVLKSDTYAKVAEASVVVVVHYFPSDDHPRCSSSVSPLNVLEGSEMALTCVSEAALPTISISWSSTPSGRDTPALRSVNHKKGAKVQSEIMIRPTFADDNNKIFMCTVKSAAFPLLSSSCHIGPLIVIRDPSRPISADETDDGTLVIDDNLLTISDSHVNDKTPMVFADGILKGNKTQTTKTCAQTCSLTSNTRGIFWVVSTIVASFCACVFLLIGICIMAKTRTLQLDYTRGAHSTYDETRRRAFDDPRVGQMYVELQKRQDDKGDLYMDLAPIDIGHCRQKEMLNVRKHTEQTYIGVTNTPNV